MLGRVSRMRVSSMTRPSSSGTLKSTRMKMRWSFSGRSRMESLDMRPRCSLVGRRWCAPALQLPNRVFADCGAALRGADECVRPYAGLQAFRCHQVNQIADTAGVSPLIVIPRDHLDTIASDYQGHGRVDDGGAGVSFEIARYQ